MPPSKPASQNAVDQLKVRLANVLEELDRESAARRAAEAQTQTCKNHLSRLAARLAETEERERRRIAADLHDRIGQTLALIKVRLVDLSFPEGGKNEKEDLINLLDRTITDTRHLVFDISPPVLYKFGLLPAIAWLREKTTREHGVAVEVFDDRWPEDLQTDTAVFCFRAVQELVTNAVKHARAEKIGVTLKQHETLLKIKVVDDGKGCSRSVLESATSGMAGYGLYHLSLQAQFFGGRLTLCSEPGRGFSATIALPLNGSSLR